MRGPGLAAALSIALLAPAHASLAAAPPEAPRAEVPIREVILSDGARRYAVKIGVGGTVMDAGLDSGSTGLRLLAPPPATGVRPEARRTSYGYGSGTKLDGVVADADVSIGTVAGVARVQLATGTSCTEAKPDCPAKRIPFSQFGVQGDGLPGEGFRAILGINMADAEISNPLTQLGVRRWIIELPRPGDAAPGRLVLDPTDQELDGYVLFHVSPQENARSALHDALDGCLVNRQTKRSICGQAIMDTGAPGIRVVTVGHESVWPNGTPGSIAFAENGKIRTAIDFTVGLRSEASHFMTETHDGVRVPRLFLGLTPYFGYSVFYDPAAGVIGLRPRRDAG